MTTRIYDDRYRGDYRSNFEGAETARSRALIHFLGRVARLGGAHRVLDYGAGSGLYAPVWEQVFPRAELSFCDISEVARQRFSERCPHLAGSYHLLPDERPTLGDGSFDVVISVEVMEHVSDLPAYLDDVARLLRPGGHFVWTTPCANRLSVEHILALLRRQIDQTPEGYRRWRWEDPTHIRRLRTREAARLLRHAGFDDVWFRFRAHLFSYVCSYMPSLGGIREGLQSLDYALFRRLPNGASMIGCARRLPPP